MRRETRGRGSRRRRFVAWLTPERLAATLAIGLWVAIALAWRSGALQAWLLTLT